MERLIKVYYLLCLLCFHPGIGHKTLDGRNKNESYTKLVNTDFSILSKEHDMTKERVHDFQATHMDTSISLQIVSNTEPRQLFVAGSPLRLGNSHSLRPLSITFGRDDAEGQPIKRQDIANGNHRYYHRYLQTRSHPGDSRSKTKEELLWSGKNIPKPPVVPNGSDVALQRKLGLTKSAFKTKSLEHDEYDLHSETDHYIHRRDVLDLNIELTNKYTSQPSPDDVHKELLNLYKTRLNYTMSSNETHEAMQHCSQLLDLIFENTTDDGNLYCDNSWDRYTCWPRTLAASTASVPCPSYLDGINNSYNATKYCHANGTWADKAFYNMCVTPMEEETLFPVGKEQEHHSSAVRIIYNTGFTISTLALIIALFIFLYFKSLRCLRNSIHCHLIVTFILNNAIWIIMRHTLIYLQEPHLSWLCRTLTSLYNFAQSTNFFWMFVEGLYLHIIFVWTYSADKIRLAYLVIIGWGLPAINIIAWIIVRTKVENDQCWLPAPDGISGYDYIYIGPILFVLFANTIFLSTIVWVLITKLRASHTLETRQYRKAVRATVILLPLLGSTYVLFIIPPSNHPTVQTVFKYINAILQSFQGLSVAVFYCFLNGEVKSVLKKKLSRFNDARSLSTKYTRASVGWTRASEFGNSVNYGNGIVMDPNRRPDNYQTHAESIPLTETRDVDK